MKINCPTTTFANVLNICNTFTGFLNANPIPHLKARVANYGLMDQIAALHWVQQNIALFGGDPANVTMLGHGSGAACINFLMISPTVMPGKYFRMLFIFYNLMHYNLKAHVLFRSIP